MADILTNAEYLKLITSEYAESPKYNAYVEAFLKMLDPAINCAVSFDEIFNLDKAVGDQLDKLGMLVGITRELPFSDPDVPSILPDVYFRKVIKARVYSDHWDGTMQGLADIIHKMYPDAVFQIVDGQDMSYQIIIIDPGSDPTFAALLFHGGEATERTLDTFSNRELIDIQQKDAPAYYNIGEYSYIIANK